MCIFVGVFWDSRSCFFIINFENGLELIVVGVRVSFCYYFYDKVVKGLDVSFVSVGSLFDNFRGYLEDGVLERRLMFVVVGIIKNVGGFEFFRDIEIRDFDGIFVVDENVGVFDIMVNDVMVV